MALLPSMNAALAHPSRPTNTQLVIPSPTDLPSAVTTDPLSSALETVVARAAAAVQQAGWRYRLAPAEVQEVFQDVRIRLWKARGGSEGGAAAASRAVENILSAGTSYVYKVATSAALDMIRRRRSDCMTSSLDGQSDKIERAEGPDASPANIGNPDEELDALELSRAVAAGVERIPASRRPVVRMYLVGYPREEIARLMGWSEAKTRNLLYRGLADLRAELTARGISPGVRAAPDPSDR
jgi:RNA polymerase sigma factor (sigma-70 family)